MYIIIHSAAERSLNIIYIESHASPNSGNKSRRSPLSNFPTLRRGRVGSYARASCALRAAG